jgi:hypothetical protein
MIFSARVANLIRNILKMAHFLYFNPAVFFAKRDEILSKLITFKYENIKFKIKECEAEHA